MSNLPVVIAGLRNQDSLPIVDPQIPHDAELAPVHTVAEIPWENIFLRGDSNQRPSVARRQGMVP